MSIIHEIRSNEGCICIRITAGIKYNVFTGHTRSNSHFLFKIILWTRVLSDDLQVNMSTVQINDLSR